MNKYEMLKEILDKLDKETIIKSYVNMFQNLDKLEKENEELTNKFANKIVIREESLNYFKINDKIKIDKDGNLTIYPNIIKGCTCK